ncbi:MAG: SDR family oxidoreductase [Actinomycetia bacterium]|nr:SDR family oxidoreductase [Actinomycetes bacterium]
MTELRESTVLITGAASGIGRRMALLAAERGANVVAWDLDGTGLDKLAADAGGVVTTHVVDVTDPDAVRRAAVAAGPVDVLVNNAGVVAGRRLLDLTDRQIERVMAVNALAPFWCTRAVLPGMVERGRGHVVTIASMAATMGVPKLVDYAASKHAAYGFAESLRVELAGVAPEVRTTVVLPFYINTGMFAGASTRIPWLVPILEEAEVAERIIRAVERNEDRVMLPPIGRVAFVGQLLPPSWFDKLASVLGIHVSMEDFHGRALPAEDTAPPEPPESPARPARRAARSRG